MTPVGRALLIACTGLPQVDSAYIDLYPVGKDYASFQRHHPACLMHSPSCTGHMNLDPVAAAENIVAFGHTELEMVESLILHSTGNRTSWPPVAHSMVEVHLQPPIELEPGNPPATAAVLPSVNHLAMVVVFSEVVAAAAALESTDSVSAGPEAKDSTVTVVIVVTESAHHHRSLLAAVE